MIKKNKALLIALILVFTSLFTACGKQKTVEAPQIKKVKVFEAKNSTITTEVEYACKIKPLKEINVSPKTPGKILAINAEVGQRVSKDDVLFTMDSKDAQAQLNQQRAGVEVSRANLEKTQDSVLNQQILSAEQAVQKAQITYDNSKYTYEKLKAGYEKLEIPRDTLNDAETKFKNASVELISSKENLKLIKEKSGPQSIESANAQVNQSIAGMQTSIIALDNLVLKSPINGTVSSKNIETGEMTSATTPAFTIIDTSEMIAEVNVSDKMVNSLRTGQKLAIKINSFSDKQFEGTIENIGSTADEKTQNYLVKIKLTNSDMSLKPGMFAKVILPTQTKENIITLPKSAIKMENGINYIYKANSGLIQKVAVNTGISDEKTIEILNNIGIGDLVVTEGQIFLNEGDKVNAIK